MIIQGEGIYFEWSFEELVQGEYIKNRIQTEIDSHTVNQINTSLTTTQLENLLTSWEQVSSGELDWYHSDFKDSGLSLNLERGAEAIYLVIEVTEEVIQTNPTTTIGIDLLTLTQEGLVEDNLSEQAKSEQAQLFELEVELTSEELTDFISDIKDNYDVL
ncbi:hypothetical protein SAMN05421767_10461 [Granulicatella balaenopterae]|uniref:Uncharacterized protein n=1 Tax=Granulicatella balaenopterae TaxID=137733 RepID=A0A1H9I528_9LACT|nr:hypothetical protein [Granulicatella balaenopterae]SEQ69648.1 hypothetical protein SAMN05421767_10461 [Granulicatella balaenopterae]